jgi:tape measure domain-containing protein
MERQILLALRATGNAQVETAIRQASRSLRSLEERGSSISRTFSGLAGTMRGVAGTLGVTFGAGAVTGLLRQIDDYHTLEARIQAATQATGDYANVSAELSRISRATGSGLQATVSVFQSLARTAPELKATNGQMLRLTETVQKLGVISGASGGQLSAGLLQFGQAMSSGVLRAEELNSLLENLPEVAAAIARGMGLTVGQLRQAVLNGKVLSRDVFDALMKQSEEIDERFRQMPASMQRGITGATQAMIEMLAAVDERLGVTQALAKSFSNWTGLLAPASPRERFDELVAERDRLRARAPLTDEQAQIPIAQRLDAAARARLGLIEAELQALAQGRVDQGRAEARQLGFLPGPAPQRQGQPLPPDLQRLLVAPGTILGLGGGGAAHQGALAIERGGEESRQQTQILEDLRSILRERAFPAYAQ